MTSPTIKAFFDENTNTVTYVVSDPETASAAIIDPVLDYDAASGRTDTRSADAVVDYVKAHALSVEWILETHVHADHLSGAHYLKEQVGGRTGIGRDVAAVQDTFRKIFNIERLAADGSQFDRLFADDDTFSIGQLEGRVLHTPGHTPACMTYVIGDAAFVGDTLFMPDFGTARCDFPGGSARTLYRSIQRILSLPADTRLFMCHDYKAPGRDEYRWETTVAEQREKNVHVHTGVTEDQFVEFREGRDAKLGMPALILPSLQANIRAGDLPDPEANGIRYFRSGIIRWRSVLTFGVPGMIGTWTGAELSVFLSGTVQLALFAVVMLLASALILRPPRLDKGPRVERALWKIAIDGLVVGVITGLVGVGGGFLIVPALVLLGGLTMHQAIATSLVIIALKSFSGFIKYLDVLADQGLGLDWNALTIVTALGIAGSLAGGFAAARLPQEQLRKGFGIFLVVMAIYILSRSFF